MYFRVKHDVPRLCDIGKYLSYSKKSCFRYFIDENEVSPEYFSEQLDIYVKQSPDTTFNKEGVAP